MKKINDKNESHRAIEKWCRERREFLERERLRMEPPILKSI